MSFPTAPYGSWLSPVSADMVAAAATGFGQLVLDGPDLCWSENRPAERGRVAVVRMRDGGAARDLIEAPFSARTRAHEYGGGAFTCADGALWFANDADQRVYRCDPGGIPRPLTAPVDARFADFAFDRHRQRLICVREDHSVSGTEPRNELVVIDDTGAIRVLAGGADFYSSPTVSPDGARLAWLAWSHPDMPWDATSLWVAEFSPDGLLHRPRRIAGGERTSVFQPQFSPDGILYFVSDRSGWWNLWRESATGVEPVAPQAAEFGLPQWNFGMSTYAFIDAGRIAAAAGSNGIWRLLCIDRCDQVALPYAEISGVRAGGGAVFFIGAAPDAAPAIVRWRPDEPAPQVLRRSSGVTLDDADLSRPQAVEFVSGAAVAHGFFYPPRNGRFRPPPGEKPPLLVLAHGGPTAAVGTGLNLRLQYWTSRGFAVLDVNYRGSTGYGRAYREALNGAWGVADVDDCVAGAHYLVGRGLVDGARLAIRGGSAGGYTALCALAFRDVFRAGASLYGVSDLEALARDTHKFEARYLDRLIGPWPAARECYRERSPVHWPQRLSCPVIFFQGLDDKVVPPDQTTRMVDALRAKGIAVACLEFPGEAHGFRRAENIRRVLEAEFYFYARVFGFTPADAIEPVAIENLR